MLNRLMDRIRQIPRRIELNGGQNTSYVQLDEVLGWIEHEKRHQEKCRKPVAWRAHKRAKGVPSQMTYDGPALFQSKESAEGWVNEQIDFGGWGDAWIEPLYQEIKEANINDIVNRFLSWQLPKSFNPDGGISFDERHDDAWNKNKAWPIGTNLLDAAQAQAMFEYVLAVK